MLELLYIPSKRRYQCEDPFFSEGDIALRATWLQKQDSQLAEYWDTMRDEIIATQQTHPITCDLTLCKGNGRADFPTLTAYEIHYEKWHRYICEECQKSFPGEEWLEMHFDEFHNVLNQISKEKGEKIYKCYVPGCPQVFSTPKMRRLHLIDKHHYSKLYPFDLPFTGNLSFREQQQRQDKGKKWLAAKKKGTAIPQKESKEPEKMDVEKPEHKKSDDMEAAMEDITQGIAKLKVPRSVSFGRASRGLGGGRGRGRGYSRQHKQTAVKGMDLDHTKEAQTEEPSYTEQSPDHDDGDDDDLSTPNRRNRIRKIIKEKHPNAKDIDMSG
ncbi:hypothetical protein K450DRAFT_212314 [Umbelopsis ramanniana AG]|uniref:C2H2-type domain-containing protein n=1 Tax=Umbelopsis ramanniana AG TaxID=1314678 RepID=A0AAD5E8Y3_UMBRA|nr:uncharacterized protein K450DRAFT_212314 [Umbelopsis ramanniana AG]KAI8577810.1 hypothetical protein K450DRAFT_212314 [Umbelopsis ramanniana AG]